VHGKLTNPLMFVGSMFGNCSVTPFGPSDKNFNPFRRLHGTTTTEKAVANPSDDHSFSVSVVIVDDDVEDDDEGLLRTKTDPLCPRVIRTLSSM